MREIRIPEEKPEMNSSTSPVFHKKCSRGKSGEKRWIIDWLESTEGERWSSQFHYPLAPEKLVTVKRQDGLPVCGVF